MRKLTGPAAIFFVLLFLPGRAAPEELFKTNLLLQKDISSYAGRDMELSVVEITLAPGTTGTKHRHPGLTNASSGSLKMSLTSLLYHS